MNNIDIYEDSPNGYRITSLAPTDLDKVINYYLDIFELYPVKKFPLEYAIANYGLGKYLFEIRSKTKVEEDRAKRMENALFYFNQALDIFTSKEYPIMFAIISILMGRLFRERSMMISHRSFLSERSTPAESIECGVDQLMEAIPLFQFSNAHNVEYAWCCLELGHLFVLQSELSENYDDNTLREQAITYLERAQTLIKRIKPEIYHIGAEGNATKWKPTDPTTYPHHIKLLIEDYPFNVIEGCCIYLIGRAEQGWGLWGLESEDYGNRQQEVNDHIQIAFDQLCLATKPKYLPQKHPFWADAHHRAALLIIKRPALVDPDYGELEVVNASTMSDIYLDSAISHLKLALRCERIIRHEIMDLHFHAAQCYISKLQLIIDRVPYGQSITKAIKDADGMEIIENIDNSLREALKRVTGANTQSAQDAYLYFFSSLKLAEYRMLQAACVTNLTLIERENHLKDSLQYIVDACVARPMSDNLDLHYIASCQLAQVLMAVKRTHGAARAYAKVLVVLSVIVNRAIFNYNFEGKSLDDLNRHSSQAYYTAVKDTTWIKLHLGPRTLHERVAAGYANWSFEDLPTAKYDQKREDSLILLTDDPDENAQLNLTKVVKPVPPRGVPPLNLPTTKLKKVFLSGDEMPEFNNSVILPGGDPNEPSKGDATTESKTVVFKPPTGPVPLHALGHSIPDDHRENDSVKESSKNEAQRVASSPYTFRMRAKVPPISEMKEIDKHNRVAFGLGKGKVVYLIPLNNTRKDQDKEKSKEKPKEKKTDISNKTDPQDRYKKRVNVKADDDESDAKNKGIALILPGGSIEGGGHENDDDNSTIPSIQKDEDDEDEEEKDDENGSPGRRRSTKIRKNAKPPSGKSEKEKKSFFNWSIFSKGKDSKENKYAPSSVEKKDDVIAIHDTSPSEEGPPPPPGPPPLNLSDVPKVDLPTKDKPKSDSAGKPPKNPKTSFNLMSIFKGNKNKAKKPNKNTPPPPSFAPPPPIKEDQEISYDSSVGLWASKECYFAFMIATRQSRIDVILRSKRLHVLDGQRTMTIMYNIKSKYRSIFFSLRKQLYISCQELIKKPLTSVKELSQLSMNELQVLFRSHAKYMKLLDDLEHFLYFKMTKVDYFVPYVTSIPTLSRDIVTLDEILLNSHTLINNITYEANIQQQKELENKNASTISKETDETKEKNPTVKSTPMKSSHSTIVSQGTKAPSAASQAISKFLSPEEKRQQDEERDDVLMGKMTYTMSRLLDGCSYLRNNLSAQGAKDMLIKYLAYDECMLIWELPEIPTQPLTVILVWRENSLSKHSHYSSSEAFKSRTMPNQTAKDQKQKNKSTPKPKFDFSKIPGIVMEFAKCDLDSATCLQYLQRYIDALNASTSAQRQTLASDALRSLSCALSITELLLMLPVNIRSLVICCPPSLRVLPWHLLLFENPKPVSSTKEEGEETTVTSSPLARNFLHEPEVEELHLVDKYCVRLGPTIALFELVNLAAGKLHQSVGYHRMCAIDGDDRFSNSQLQANRPSSRSGEVEKPMDMTVAGIRGADLEVASVAHTWSADPEDYTILADQYASPISMETSNFADRDIDSYRHFRKIHHFNREKYTEDFIKEMREKEKKLKKLRKLNRQNNRVDTSSEEEDEDEEEEREEKNHVGKEEEKEKIAKSKKINQQDGDHKDEEDDEEEENENEDNFDEDDERAIADYKERLRMKHMAKEVKRLQKYERQMKDNIYQLTMCRVLHICANKNLFPRSMAELSSSMTNDPLSFNVHPDIQLEASIQLPLGKSEASIERGNRLSSSDVIKQLFMKNCALCVLSRFGILDDVIKLQSHAVESNWEFVESFHLAGACTILAPLWNGGGQGLGTLANILFLVRFYSILPAKSRDRISIVETSRKAQLWLRDVTANDAIAFIAKASIPAKARKVIIAEMESYVTSSLSPEKSKESKNIARAKTDPGEDGNRVGGSQKFFTHFLNWGSFFVSGHGGSVHHPDITAKGEDEEKAIFGDGKWDIDKELDNIIYEAEILRMEGKIAEAVELEKRIRQLRMLKMKNRLDKIKAAGWRAGRGFLDTLDYLDKAFLDQDSDEISVSDEDDPRKKRGKSYADKDSDEEKESEEDEKENEDESENPDKPRDSDEKSQALSKGFRPLEQDRRAAIYDSWRSKVGSLSMEVKQPTLPSNRRSKNLAGQKNIKPNPQKTDNYEFNLAKQHEEHEDADDEEEEDDYDEDEEEDDEEDDDEEEDDEEDDEEDEEEDEEGGRKGNRRNKRDVLYDDYDEHGNRRQKAKKKSKAAKALKKIRGNIRSYDEIALMLANKPMMKNLENETCNIC